MNHRANYDEIADSYDLRYDRYEWKGVEATIKEFVGTDSNHRILEVGCGTGHWLALFSQQGRAVAGLDSSKKMLNKARSRMPSADFVLGSAESLPWPDASFDRIFCMNAFHQFDKKNEFLVEAFRVLRPPGGILIVGSEIPTEHSTWSIYKYFNGTLETDKSRYIPTELIRSWMTEIGFVRCETVEAQHMPGKWDAKEALTEGLLDKKTSSQLSLLTDEEYSRGINQIERDIRLYEERGEKLLLVSDLRLFATSGWVE